MPQSVSCEALFYFNKSALFIETHQSVYHTDFERILHKKNGRFLQFDTKIRKRAILPAQAFLFPDNGTLPIK